MPCRIRFTNACCVKDMAKPFKPGKPDSDVEDLLREILGVLKAILAAIAKPPPPPTKSRVVFGFKVGQPKAKVKRMPLDLKITNEQKISVTVNPVTDTGKPAKLDGMPSWAVISGNSALTVSDDGMTGTLTSADDPGDTEVLVKADADLGEGVEEISDTIHLSVVGATAKNLGLVAGAPEPK